MQLLVYPLILVISQNYYLKKLNIIEIFKSKYVFIGLLIGILASYKIFTYYHERSLKEKYIANVTIVYREKRLT